jgi:hypothetical protein
MKPFCVTTEQSKPHASNRLVRVGYRIARIGSFIPAERRHVELVQEGLVVSDSVLLLGARSISGSDFVRSGIEKEYPSGKA